MKIKNLVISGAGITGIGFLGIIKYLEEKNLLNDINTYLGTSAGSIIIYLLSINYNSLELIEFCKHFNFEKILGEFSLDNMFTNFGFNHNNKWSYVLRRMTESKKFSHKITFKEHFELTKIKLIIVACCLNESKTYYLSYENYPNMEIIEAIKISCCVPIYFQPIKFDNKLWVDGGLTNNFPIDYFKKEDIKYTLGISINDAECHNDINELNTYFKSLFKCLIHYDTLKKIETYKNNIIKFNCNICGLSNYAIDKHSIESLVECGYNCCINSYNVLSKFLNDDIITSESIDKTDSDIIKIMALKCDEELSDYNDKSSDSEKLNKSSDAESLVLDELSSSISD